MNAVDLLQLIQPAVGKSSPSDNRDEEKRDEGCDPDRVERPAEHARENVEARVEPGASGRAIRVR